jgi:Spy/CpxP family protein refolding chaperone
MMKKLLCALVVLTAVPALAEDKKKEDDVRVFVHSGHGSGFQFSSSSVGHGSLAPPSFGIPSELVEKLGLSKTVVQKIQDMTFEANDSLISLEAELKRAQLSLERELRQPSPNEATVKDLVEKVGRAETAVRQNRVGLMVAIKKVLGPDNWQKLEAEMGPVGSMGMFPRRFHFERHAAPPAPPRTPPVPRTPAPAPDAEKEREERRR